MKTWDCGVKFARPGPSKQINSLDLSTELHSFPPFLGISPSQYQAMLSQKSNSLALASLSPVC